MNQKPRRYAAILLTAAFCASAFSAAVFAEEPVSSDTESSSEASSEVSSEPFIPATIQITMIYDNGEQTSVQTVDVGSRVSSLPTPERKGYKFAGWTLNGTVLPSSEELLTDTTLTASWTKIAASSSRARSSRAESRGSSSHTPVDTRESEIEAIASEADHATSDPGVLSSENWQELLTSSEASAPSSAASGVSSAAEETTSGGFSWLFAVGAALIVLALGGIGLFVYLQFFSGPHKPHGGNGSHGGSDDDMVFTDVSSFSDPAAHTQQSRNPDLEDTIPIGPAARGALPKTGQNPRKPVPNKPAPPAPKPAAPKPKAPKSEPPLAPKAQAKPVTGEKSDFDWEKFFNEDDSDK